MQRFFSRILNLGVTDNSGFAERKKLRLLNLYCFLGIPLCVYFIVQNLAHANYALIIVDCMLLFAALMYVAIAWLKPRLEFPRTFFLIVSSITLSVSAIYFNNEAELFLLFNIILCFLIFNSSKTIYWLTIFFSIQFLFVKFVRHANIHPFREIEEWVGISSVPFEPLGTTRVMVLIVFALFLMIISIAVFRDEYLFHLLEIKKKGEKLQVNQHLLIQQKQEVEQKNTELEVLNRTKEKLFSIVAHDIKSPITALKGMLDLYHKNQISAEEFQTMLPMLTSQVTSLQYNVENILHWSLSQLNGIVVSPTACSLKDVVDDVTILHEGLLSAKNIQVHKKFTQDYYVFADVNHVHLIMSNLLSNAVKFSYAGSTIEVDLFDDGTFAGFTIQDFGKGMDGEKLNKLFEYTESRSTRGTQNEKGTGLGLLICNEFCIKNGGNIRAVSEPGKGSKFIVSLPKLKEAGM